MKYEFDLIGGGTPSKLEEKYWGGNIPWVSPKDMKTDIIIETEDYITKAGLQNSTTNLIDKDSLLMVVRSGILQRTIPIALSGISLTINQDIKAFLQKRNIKSKFLYYYIKGNEKSLLNNILKQGATVESVEVDFLNNLLIAAPLSEEQTEIIEYLDSKTSEFDNSIIKITETVEKLILYRQSIISEAVTGKIDVRGWFFDKAQKPEKTENN